MRGGTEVCVLAGAGDVDASVIDAPPGDGPADASTDGPPLDAPPNWWNLAWTHRRPIDVTAGTNGMPAGYSIAITIDHAALVGSGASLASGGDVRIVRDDGTPVDRVLDTGAAWNTAATRLWFKADTALAANATARYWVYYGNATPGAPPANPSTVFLFSDDFESGLARWSVDTGVTTTTARVHRGTRSLVTPATTASSRGAYTNGINEANVAWDIWWNIDVPANTDANSSVRGESNSVYLSNLQPPATGQPPTWNIAKYVNSMYSVIIPPPNGATPAVADTWFRVTFYAYADRMAVDINGVRYVPASGFSPVGATTAGSVGVNVYTSTAGVYFDDATLRRFVLPEPVVAIGVQQSLP